MLQCVRTTRCPTAVGTTMLILQRNDFQINHSYAFLIIAESLAATTLKINHSYTLLIIAGSLAANTAFVSADA